MGIFDIFKRQSPNSNDSKEESLKETCDRLLDAIKARIISEPALFAVSVDLADQYESKQAICDSLAVDYIGGVYAHVSCVGYYKVSQLAYFWENANFTEDPTVYDILHSSGDIVVLQNIRTSELLLQQREGFGGFGVFYPVEKDKRQQAIERWMEELEIEAKSAQTFYDEEERKWVIDFLKIYAGKMERKPLQVDEKEVRKAEDKYDKKTGNDRRRHWEAVNRSTFKYVKGAEEYKPLKVLTVGHEHNENQPHISHEEAEFLSNSMLEDYYNTKTSRLEPVIPCIHKDETVTFEGNTAEEFELVLPTGKVISEKNVNRVVLYRNAGDRYVIEGVYPTFTTIEDRNLIYYDDLESMVIVSFSNKELKGQCYFYQVNVYSEGIIVDSFENVTNFGVYEIGHYWAEAVNGLNLPCGFIIKNGKATQIYSRPGECTKDEIEEMQTRVSQEHKLDLIENEYVKIPFFINGSKPSVTCYQFCKENADVFEENGPLLPEDDTTNCTCWFKKDRLRELEFIRFCGGKSGGGIMKGGEFRRFLGNGYFKRNAHTLTNYYSQQLTYRKAVQKTESDRETVKMLFEICGEPLDIEKFPEVLMFSVNEEEVMDTLSYILRGKITSTSTSELKKLYEEYYSKAVDTGVTKRRWCREYELFKAVSRLYQDTEFQYRAEWLQRQSLDIFIPSLRIGIEYQGQQHYNAVDFFGGEESYYAQVERDSEKRRKCETNNIGLIYWKYDTAINKRAVAKAIEMCKENGFVEI